MRYYPVEFQTPKGGKKPRSYHAFYRDYGDHVKLKVVKVDEETVFHFLVDMETIDRIEDELTSISVARGRNGNYLQAVIAEPKPNEPMSRTFGQWMFGDVPEGYQVDHINRDTTDYRLENLRVVTISDNLRNRRGWGKWGKGISKDANGYFIPKISLGRFETQEEAEQAYQLASDMLFPTKREHA